MASESRRRRSLWVLLALAFATSCGCIPSCNLVQARDRSKKQPPPGTEPIEQRRLPQQAPLDAGPRPEGHDQGWIPLEPMAPPPEPPAVETEGGP